MLKTILKFFIPTIIELLGDGLQKWLDDPETDTENVAINDIESYLKYVAEKKLR